VIEVDVPGWRCLRLTAVALDVNGVLTLDGELLLGLESRVAELRSLVAVHLLSADTHGRLDQVSATLGVAAMRLREGGEEAEQKARFVRELGAAGVAAIGNGANDVGMLREAELSIAVLGPEGLARGAADSADILVTSVHEALDLLLRPRRLLATLRR
jgi:P-type E1-E2 ATPase